MPSSNICLSCGLCCDGTLIGFVKVDREEIPILKEFMDIEVVDENGFFIQPCKKFCDACTVYTKRPKQCGIFKCGLLKSVEQKHLEFDKAVTFIEDVKQRKTALENKLESLDFKLKSNSFYFKMVELKNLLEKDKTPTSLSKEKEDLIKDLNQLDTLLTVKFDLSLF
jgi:hypothetical protein